MKGGKNDKKKKDAPPKPPFAPIREPLEKPELSPEEELEELKKAYQEKGALYFSGPIEAKISNIITLFSRTNDEIITYSELRVDRSHRGNPHCHQHDPNLRQRVAPQGTLQSAQSHQRQ